MKNLDDLIDVFIAGKSYGEDGEQRYDRDAGIENGVREVVKALFWNFSNCASLGGAEALKSHVGFTRMDDCAIAGASIDMALKRRDGEKILPTSPGFCEWRSHPPYGDMFRACTGIVVNRRNAGATCDWCGKLVKFGDAVQPLDDETKP